MILQIFTNADKAHAAKVLSKLGLEDCFEGVICFETLNPSNDNHGDSDNLSMTETGVENSDSEDSSEYETDESVSGGCSHIVCKPSPEAFLAAIRLAKVNPKKTVSTLPSTSAAFPPFLNDVRAHTCFSTDIL